MNDKDKKAFMDWLVTKLTDEDQEYVKKGEISPYFKPSYKNGKPDINEAWEAACAYKEKQHAINLSQMLHALIKISQYNKNDGNAPLDNSGPSSMEYWRWQESISRRIASEAIDNYKEEI